jgi:4-carboxymuconolactone decarboxylase
MAVTETAQQNHDELFPGHVSTLKVTDPELVEVFDNFAFDEVLRHSGLDTRTRLMVQLGHTLRSGPGRAGADRRPGSGGAHVHGGG